MDTIEELGVQIEKLDTEILMLLAQRLKLSRQVGEFKVLRDAPIVRPDVELVRSKKFLGYAERLGVDTALASALWYIILGASCREQVAVFDKKKRGAK